MILAWERLDKRVLNHRKEKVLITIKEYIRAESLEQAYELNQKRSNQIIGGMLWVKMGSRQVQKAIDLSDIVSDTILETEDAFIIGAMTSLHEVEVHPGLNQYTGCAIKESLRHIVGIQFRNVATAGGSIFGRFGFSDVLTMLLALDSYVELYRAGVVSLEEFAAMPSDTDILLNVIIKKTPIKAAYSSVRNTKTDFPILACAVSVLEKELRVVIGGRPQRAVILHCNCKKLVSLDGDQADLAEELANEAVMKIAVGGNMRASAEYRRHLVKVLTRRTCLEALGKGGELTCR